MVQGLDVGSQPVKLKLSTMTAVNTILAKARGCYTEDPPSGRDDSQIHCTRRQEAKAAITNDLERRYTEPDLHVYLEKAMALDRKFKSLPYLDIKAFDML
ncbi:unnamed protein product [Pleuronectes platessa]|uniref:Uncharacterized protein n=1 Tax=Pleuronectes platessa TaxID=8262 RepID=A0A9N7UHE6_PLEPL|nr:unnamed protein product [Pleuronectes platessa]